MVLVMSVMVTLKQNKKTGGFTVTTSDTDTWSPSIKIFTLGRNGMNISIAEATKNKADVGIFRKNEVGWTRLEGRCT